MMLQAGFQCAVDVQPGVAAARPPYPDRCDERVEYGCHVHCRKGEARCILLRHRFQEGPELFTASFAKGMAVSLRVCRAGNRRLQQAPGEKRSRNVFLLVPKRTEGFHSGVNPPCQRGKLLPFSRFKTTQLTGCIGGLLHLLLRYRGKFRPAAGNRLLYRKTQQGEFQ